MDNKQTTYPKTVSFIVLALNEEAHIRNTFDTIEDSARKSSLEKYETILVNDGSTDKTGRKMDELAEHKQNTKVIHNQKNLGFGSAYIEGVKKADMEYVMIIAGDNIMPVDSIIKILDSVGNHDIILPYMTDAVHRNKIRSLGSWFFARLVNLINGRNVTYYNSMVVRRLLFNNINVFSKGYTLQAECVSKFLNNGASFTELGVPHGFKLANKTTSHALKIKNIKNTLYTLYKLRKQIRLRSFF